MSEDQADLLDIRLAQVEALAMGADRIDRWRIDGQQRDQWRPLAQRLQPRRGAFVGRVPVPEESQHCCGCSAGPSGQGGSHEWVIDLGKQGLEDGLQQVTLAFEQLGKSLLDARSGSLELLPGGYPATGCRIHRRFERGIDHHVQRVAVQVEHGFLEHPAAVDQ
ncbi:hypothetical protein [Luteibacter sp. dw_328]|uniref:hypothetical protein n=1 Tax=Luteibacter sp. dw_328 TaxID=2719796 RepID=UPI001BD1D417|nr:hypothetical protein [Luteibacter sp. dw_328]